MSKSKTRISTRRSVDVQTEITRVGLSDEEEKVLRMRYGIAMGPEEILDERAGLDAGQRQQLRMLEDEAIAHLRQSAEHGIKRAIIAELREI